MKNCEDVVFGCICVMLSILFTIYSTFCIMFTKKNWHIQMSAIENKERQKKHRKIRNVNGLVK